jgi:periplasmic divalent cation tolerance protein
LSSQSEIVELLLSCPSWQEAYRIGDHLLSERLVVCVEYLEIKSKYHWQKTIEEAKEIKLIMLSTDSNFKHVEKAVAKMHSYDTFVLQQLPVANISAKARDWLLNEVEK